MSKKNNTTDKRAQKQKKSDLKKRRENIAVFTTLGICIALILLLVVLIIVRNVDWDTDDGDTTTTSVTAGETLTHGDFTYYKNKEEGIGILSYNGNAEVVEIPDKIDGIEVKYVWDAFRNNETVKEVIIPNTVIELDGCFEGCKNLTKVTFYNSVSIIYENTFKDCEKLSDVVFYGSPQHYEMIELYDGRGSNAKLFAANVSYEPYN